MKIGVLIEALQASGVQLRVEGGELRWRARKGAVTEAMRAGIEEHRAALTARMSRLPERIADWPAKARETYEERAGIGEYVGGMDRAEAERAAEAAVRLAVARVEP